MREVKNVAHISITLSSINSLLEGISILVNDPDTRTDVILHPDRLYGRIDINGIKDLKYSLQRYTGLQWDFKE